MKIILFTHPTFLAHQSMPRYASMLQKGMEDKGHQVVIWSPKARFYKIPLVSSLKKWMGYIDQYVLFPIEVKFKLKKCSKDTLFVFADQALGPWVPLVKNRKHIVHCHDFLALKSALGMIPENPTSFTGKQYQNYIRKGFSKGKNFISISKKTEQDLQQFHQGNIESSSVCYNGLSRPFYYLSESQSIKLVETKLRLSLTQGYIMHIGGNMYYKNRKGVMEIYNTWRANYHTKIPLLLIGEKPSDELLIQREKSAFNNDIYFISDVSDEYINSAYSGAKCLLFPSLDEGFGWPIIEAMASGCPVITVNKAPMNEVGGTAAYYIEPMPNDKASLGQWKKEAATVLEKVVSLQAADRKKAIEKSLQHSNMFSSEYSLNAIETVYKMIHSVE
ncbi:MULTISPECIES: glycosyltransferase [Flavobacterium]|uniref:glycosyltransferase n=1 Tax=Flavobacterium TaxID=237 RepID=UPI001C7CB32B|nr:glycosyltransferase [Flavobacterium sp. UMI-01]GIZ10045.1 hypothetical protein FUMI01_27710 [Flavobacterium sp. UMI-01]